MKPTKTCCLCGNEFEAKDLVKIWDGVTLKDTGERVCKVCAKKKSYKAK